MSNILNNLVTNFSFFNLDFIFDKWNTIKNHDIVLVGEATHGAKECIKFKSALFKFLVENESFNILALESNKYGTEKINRYINGEIKDIDNIIKDLGFWFYDCVEFRDLIEWMKYQNIYKNKKLYVYGFDIFYPELCVEFIVSNIKTESKKDANLIQNNYNLFLCFKKNNYIDYYKTSKNFKRKCKNLLIENFNLLKTKYCKLQNITEILQNAQIILQAEHYFSILNFTNESYAARDKYMSDNIIWLHKRMLHSKIFVWAHNGHVSIKKYSNGFTNMGYNIQKYFKNSLHIGMTFYKGFFYAIHSDDILPSVNFIPPPNINYIEHYLNKISKTSFIFDFNKVSKQNRFKFFNKIYNFRSIGVIFNLLYFEKYYCKANIYKDFDAIIYFKNITPISLNEKIINIQNMN